MLGACVLEHGSALYVSVFGQTVVDIGGGVQADPAVPVFVVVPLGELVHEISCLTQRLESFWEGWSVFEGVEQCFGIRIVVRDPWPRVASGDLQIGEQRGHGCAGDRKSKRLNSSH